MISGTVSKPTLAYHTHQNRCEFLYLLCRLKSLNSAYATHSRFRCLEGLEPCCMPFRPKPTMEGFEPSHYSIKYLPMPSMKRTSPQCILRDREAISKFGGSSGELNPISMLHGLLTRHLPYRRMTR